MSPEAIDRRLRKLSQLRRFGMSLQEARWLGKIRDIQEESAQSRPRAVR